MSSTEMLLNPEVTFDEQLEVFLAFAKSLAHQASQMIRDGQADRFAADSNSSSENENVEKLSSVDLVTQVDKSVEDFLMSSIAQAYPTHKFVGEEMVSAGEKEELTDEWTWIIDPIDGTMNFVHSFNAVGCSIGLTYKKEPVVGVIAMPFANQVVGISANLHLRDPLVCFWSELSPTFCPCFCFPRPSLLSTPRERAPAHS